MDVDLRGDEDDEEMGVDLIEDHCIHFYHQSIWNEFASLDSMMEVGTSNTVFKEYSGELRFKLKSHQKFMMN